MSIENELTKEDIASLLEDHSTAAKMEVVQKLAVHYSVEGNKALSPEEAKLADGIFKLVLNSAAVEVRELLAKNLSKSAKLPPELVRRLARDVHEVACPILERSATLSDEELIGFINADTEKLQAIARRPSVSEALSDALVETRREGVVSTLVGNDGAMISDLTFDKVAERHGGSTLVVESILQRRVIPGKILEKVIVQMSKTMRENLERKYGSMAELKEIRQALDQSLELTSLRMLGFHSTDDELMRLLRDLDGSDKMAPFAAISMGNLRLFEAALARLLHIPAMNMHALMQDPNGFQAAYVRAGLPDTLFEAVALTVQAIRDIEKENANEKGTGRALKSDEVMKRMEELAANKKVAGLDYLRAMMQRCTRMSIKPQTMEMIPRAGAGVLFSE
jgi:uncharacterized protein (DUF2336 family)